MDLGTLERWIHAAGLEAVRESSTSLRVASKDDGPPVPPFIVQLSEHWLLLSILPMHETSQLPDGLGLMLLAANREMRLAKFAVGAEGDLVLCAELPTESLDESELSDAVTRMIEYARKFRRELALG